MSCESSLNPNKDRTSSNSVRIFSLVLSLKCSTLSKLIDTGASKKHELKQLAITIN